MQGADLLNGFEVFKEVTPAEVLLFIAYVVLIFIVKAVINRLLAWLIRSPRLKEQVLPVVETILNWLAFYGIILLFLSYFWGEKWLLYSIYETDGVEISLFLLIVMVMFVTLASRLAKAFNRHVMPFIYEQFNVNIGMRYTFNRLIYYTVMFLALALSFTTVGLDLTAVGVVFSVLGIGIGFGIRNIAANFVSGIIILFERPMEVGEMVEIDKKIGKITKIKLRSTEVETLKDGTLIVPNQYFIEQIVKNRSGAKLFARVIVGVAYGSDTDLVEQLLKRAAKMEQQVMEGVPAEEPDVQFIDFRNTAMDFQVEVRVTDALMKVQLESRIRHSVAKLLFENGIQLAENPQGSLK